MANGDTALIDRGHRTLPGFSRRHPSPPNNRAGLLGQEATCRGGLGHRTLLRGDASVAGHCGGGFRPGFAATGAESPTEIEEKLPHGDVAAPASSVPWRLSMEARRTSCLELKFADEAGSGITLRRARGPQRHRGGRTRPGSRPSLRAATICSRRGSTLLTTVQT